MDKEVKQLITVISSLPDGMVLSIVPENEENDQQNRLKKIAVYISSGSAKKA